jgi:tetratricopeptide (TPR) repeat protein
MYLAVMGQFDEAIREYKRARTLDPLSLFANLQVAQVYYHSRQYDQAIEEFRKTLEMDPYFPIAHTFLSWSYLQKGMYEEACAAAQKGIDLSGGDPVAVAGLGYVCGSAGRRDEAIKALAELKERGHITPLYLALIYIGLGEKDKAFEWLERSYEERDSWIIWLISPLYDRIRSDPRFTALLKKMNLE